VGFADVKLDRDDTIRRALLYADDEDGEPQLSLSMQMALRWLHGEGVGLSVDDQERLVLGSTPLPRLEPDTGAYVGTDAGGYQTLIDWDGRTPHESLSFTRLLANDFDPALIRDRMVFVGALAESVSDLRRSPFGLWAGVYIHAHIASQLVRYGTGEDEPLVSASEGVELAWIALWALLGAGFGLLRSSVPLLVVGGLAGLALLAAGGHVGMQAGLWLPIVPPSLSWLIAAGGVTAYLSRAERAERDSLMGLFSRHVSEDVARELWERRDEFSEGGRPKPQRQCVTVAFFDVRGFTPIAERLGPLRVTEWVNELMNALAEETERHGGFVDDYFGDGMKAAFGVPVARTEPEMQRADAVASVEAALAARRRLEQLNRRWNAEGLPTGHVRVGIHTGFVVAASIGSATRLKYTVLGDAVNTAARIEALDDGGHDFDARPARILVSQATLDRLAGAFDAKPLGEFALKGKEERVQVHEILGRAS
jgi:adenylate cyclase